MSITFGGGTIGIVFEKTAGTVHTTTVHLIPIWLIILIVAAVFLPIWLGRKSRD